MDDATRALRAWRSKRKFFEGIEEDNERRKDVNINLTIRVDGKTGEQVVPYPSA